MTYVAEMKSGEVQSGLLVSRSSDAIELKSITNTVQRIGVGDIEETGDATEIADAGTDSSGSDGTGSGRPAGVVEVPGEYPVVVFRTCVQFHSAAC